jgi:hypothetical protein
MVTSGIAVAFLGDLDGLGEGEAADSGAGEGGDGVRQRRGDRGDETEVGSATIC